MICDNTIIGRVVDLTSVTEEDAGFILGLRTDKKTSKFLNQTENCLLKQVAWIQNQMKSSDNYYFLISDKKGEKLGTIALYNLEKDIGEFGRWICTGNSIQALESVILLHDFGFFALGLKSIYSATNYLNKTVINFNKNFGATFTNEKIIHKTSGIIMEKAIIESEKYPLIRQKNLAIIDKLI